MEKERRKLIAGNWKMFKTSSQAVETAQRLVSLSDEKINDTDVMIAPPFTALDAVSKITAKSLINLGAQNIFWENEGAFTGEISAPMIISAGCRYVITGHSERRQFFNETNETVNKKIACALKNNLTPILCIGESEDERETGKTFSVLDKQIQIGLEGFLFDELLSLIIAYEPVWAIGTGKTATAEQAQEVHQYIRSNINKRFTKKLGKTLRILYGGSVKPENTAGLMAMPDIDGALVGGASLDAETFFAIIQQSQS